MSKTLPEIYFVLAKTRELIAEPSQWCQYMWHHNNQRCLEDALIAALGDDYNRLYSRASSLLVDAAHEHTGRWFAGPVNFNDATNTKHADVIAVLDKAMTGMMRGTT